MAKWDKMHGKDPRNNHARRNRPGVSVKQVERVQHQSSQATRRRDHSLVIVTPNVRTSAVL